MRVSQVEQSPIGNYFHDSGVTTVFNALAQTVDDFEIDTDQLNSWCENIIKSIKGLQSHIKACEKEWLKHEHQKEINDMINRGAE